MNIMTVIYLTIFVSIMLAIRFFITIKVLKKTGQPCKVLCDYYIEKPNSFLYFFGYRQYLLFTSPKIIGDKEIFYKPFYFFTKRRVSSFDDLIAWQVNKTILVDALPDLLDDDSGIE